MFEIETLRDLLRALEHVFSALPGAARCARASFHMTRKVVTPKSNCISGGDCSTTCACTMYKFSVFAPDFRHRKQWISEKFCDHAASISSKIIFWKYHGFTLRIKKVIRSQATVLHDAGISKTRNFRKYWWIWAVWCSNVMNFVRWRDFNALRRCHAWFHVTRRVVTPKSNTGRGQFTRTNCSGSMGRFRSSLAFCLLENASF